MGTLRDVSRWIDRLEERTRAVVPEPAPRRFELWRDEEAGVRNLKTGELLSPEAFEARGATVYTITLDITTPDDGLDDQTGPAELPSAAGRPDGGWPPAASLDAYRRTAEAGGR
jgi:hypothetical protein